jgi:hypothetical protein
MSKFSEALKATPTGKVGHIPMKNLLLNTSVNYAHYDSFGLTKEVLIEARFGVKKMLASSPSGNLQFHEIQEIFLQDMRRALVEEVFGEFRPIITELYEAMYDQDTTAMRAAITKLDQRMFDV